MPTIVIREGRKTEEGFAATVEIERSRYDITVRDPFDGRQEEDLAFYFEEWIRFPFDEQVRAQRAAASVKDYGERLFDDVFASRRAYSDYQRVCAEGLSELRIEIEGASPAFQALHWEALKDPDGARPLAVECVFTRRRFQERGLPVGLKPSSEINLLVVTARPDEEDDVGYRTISRPLIEAIERGRLRVNVELLRPGTFAALSEHLERKAGFYHIVHFDAHGGLMSYAQYEQYLAGGKQDRYTFQARRGRADMERYAGEKSFLFFEGASKGEADPVEAQELADLLANKGIPICILNACQSGMQVNSVLPDGEMRETSLGSRLMAAGVQTVVAMGYSVTVSAAALMMEKLYGALFEERGVPEAIRLGRKELHEEKNRRAYFNQVVELEDWLLPVVYVNGEVDLRLRDLDFDEEDAYYERLNELASRYEFGQPQYGFIGRDLEILKIEKALLSHNVLLLRGMGGTGKTTLLRYLWRWWITTDFARDAFYFGYDEGAYTVDQIVHTIGQSVYRGKDYDRFIAKSSEIKIAKLVETLRSNRHVLILDNLESVTGQSLSIPNTLPEEEQKRLRLFLTRLRGGQTKVVLGSRSPEEWLADALTFEEGKNQYVLGGLDPESRTVLAEKILAAQVKDAKRVAALRGDAGFARLMKLLAGYPLAMEVVLGNLARQSPAEVLAGLDAADVEGFDVGGEEKTNNILKCVEYSHSNLSADAQKLLVCLAPFSGFIFRADLENYGKQLQQLEPFKDYVFERFDEAVQEAIQWGLLSPMDENEQRFLTIQPVFPYFLRTKLQKLNKATQSALEEGFSNHYKALGVSYEQLLRSKEPAKKYMGTSFCRLEYENLSSALKICLKRKESFDMFVCLDEYLEIDSKPESRELLMSLICAELSAYPPQFLKQKSGYQVPFAFHRAASSYLGNKRYEESRKMYESAIDAYEQLEEVEEQQKQLWIAGTYHQLGMVAQALREYEQARSHYQQALDIYIEYNDRYSQASTYHQLGMVAQALREYEQAQSHYQQALDIYIEYNDRYEQAGTYHQLGMVAEELREYEQAQKHYQQALEIFIEFQDQHNAAIVMRSLARIYKTSQDDSLLTGVAQCSNSTVEEVAQMFETLNNQQAE